MKKKTANQKKSLSISKEIPKPIKEVILLILSSITLFCYLALITYNPGDPSWLHTNEQDTENLGGYFGAYISESLLFFFGYSSYIFVLIFIYLGKASLYKKNNDYSLTLRILGFLLAVITLSAILSIHSSSEYLHAGSGGYLGEIIKITLIKLFNVVGSSILLLTVFIVGITLWLKISWISIVDYIGDFIVTNFRSAYQKLFFYFDSYINKEKNFQKSEILKQKIETMGNVDKIKIEPQIEPIKKSDKTLEEKQIALFDSSSINMTPPLDLLSDSVDTVYKYSDEALKTLSNLVELKLNDYGIKASVVAVNQGPVITRFELEPDPGVKGDKITALTKDLARALSVENVRVIEVIPGKNTIGLEIPNENRETVYLSEIIKSSNFDKYRSDLALALGKDISGSPVIVDLLKMPHLLVAGTTGSGKSVAINSMILSVLYKSTPAQVKLILIDPKMLELGVYDGIPHLLTPVVTDMNLAFNALSWCVKEMERRYELLAENGSRNIDSFNSKVEAEGINNGEQIPKIVIVIDEFADLFFAVGKRVEELIIKIAQKARAAGIHLILATQRPSVDVITGLIKANIPTRIAFQVSSKTDSRVILDQTGSENLLGNGDMLYLESGKLSADRVHGAYVSDQEVREIVSYLKSSNNVSYLDEVTEDSKESVTKLTNDEDDPLYAEAVSIVLESNKASISYVQRRLKVGYNRAARMIEKMEELGIVTPVQKNGSREVVGKIEN